MNIYVWQTGVGSGATESHFSNYEENFARNLCCGQAANNLRRGNRIRYGERIALEDKEPILETQARAN